MIYDIRIYMYIFHAIFFIHCCAVRDASHTTSRIVADEGGQGRAQGPEGSRGKPDLLGTDSILGLCMVI